MKRIFTLVLIGLALCGSARAAQTNIAQVPLLNISGTGTVKPNLMLLYDDSGSMAFTFAPDYVGYNTKLCRSGGASLSSGQVLCVSGHPPFNSSDFNRIYYNPAIQYVPPVNADGTSYPMQNRKNTTDWTSVSTDAFAKDRNTLNYTVSETTTDLTSGLPDLKWCTSTSGGSCAYNTASYTYPNSTYKYAQAASSNAYYYTINVAEYCTDATLKVCQTTAVGAAAPAGYPVPAKVRWCDSTALTNCQAKRINGFVWPRFSSTSASVTTGYGTITVNATAGTTLSTITKVTVAESGGAVDINNSAIAVAGGTNTSAKQATTAEAIAAEIVNKTGLSNQYTACVKSPAGSVVPACSTWGITLPATNIVAVIPIDCVSGNTNKSLGQCQPVSDNSRSGWGISVSASASSTALITVSGTTSTSNSPSLASGTKLGTTVLINSSTSLGKNKDATSVASKLAGAIGTVGTVTAYIGGNSVTTACAAATSASVCLVDTAGAVGRAVTMASLSNNVGAGGNGTGGSIVFTTTNSTAGADVVQFNTAPLSAGSAIFVRTDIVPTRTSYPKAEGRADCVSLANACSYDEEMTNFANWYTYYKSRNQMMKTAVGRAFQPVSGNFRVGFVPMSVAQTEGTMTLPADFTGTARSNWYTKLYATGDSGATPMRLALNAVGKMYAQQGNYAGNGVVQYPCQQNFVFLTTDGFWNGGAPSYTGAPANNDDSENPARFCNKIRGCVDTRAQSTPSLADIALYWYNGGSNTGTSTLNASIDDLNKVGQVPAGAGENTHLHMNTYTLGLGMDGVMNYEPDYDRGAIVGGDFYKLLTNVQTGCPWNANGAYVWPDPQTGDPNNDHIERVDDLWHAAINGHGKYFSASDPQDVVAGLNAALNNIQVRIGAAAAAATSTPNISQQDNDIFSDTFTTVKWYGELTDRKIDTVTGKVSTTIQWTTSDQLGQQVSAASDARNIYMRDMISGGFKNFSYANLSALEKSWFDNKCSLLAQCSSLSTADRAKVDSGANLVNWLRGQQQHADDAIFRAYAKTTNTPAGATGPVPIVLGDIASAKPAFLREPRKGYTFGDYPAFKTRWNDRQSTVFAAANDGMLHAFKAGTGDHGEEMWAYAPRITMKKLYLQASTTYGTNHQFTTDGSPEIADVQIGGVWKTVLVAGLNGGGRGYYALDVTDPLNPVPLWEICADVTICPSSDARYADLGLTFGNPQFGMWHNQWVVFVTSGYNNVPGTDGVNAGDGGGYLYILDVATGAILNRTATGSGNTTTPSGFAKITAISDDPNSNPAVTQVYGGDILGQMWRFDLTDKTSWSVVKTSMGAPGATQPITTAPDVTLCQVNTTDASGVVTSRATKKVVLWGTGRLLDVPDVSNTDLQTIYLIKDSNQPVATLRNGSELVQQTLSSAGTGSYAITNNTVDLTTKAGWYVDLDRNAGERVNLDPKITSGTASVVTNIPTASSSCSVGGTSNVYTLNVCTGSYVSHDKIAGTVLSNTSAAVGFIIVRLPSGALKMITTTADGSTVTTGVTSADSVAAHKSGWRRVH